MQHSGAFHAEQLRWSYLAMREWHQQGPQPHTLAQLSQLIPAIINTMAMGTTFHMDSLLSHLHYTHTSLLRRCKDTQCHITNM